MIFETKRFPFRIVLIVGGIAILLLAFSLVDLSPDLDHLNIKMLSGPSEANYHAIVTRPSTYAWKTPQ